MDSTHTRADSTQERQNVRTIIALESAAHDSETLVDHLIGRIADVAAHPAFIAIHLVWFGCWIGYNVTTSAFDPFPFSFLTLVVSLEAILLGAFLLIAQNRMASEADRRTRLDLQINLLAEQELTSILRVLCRVSERLGVNVSDEPALSELQRRTDVTEIVALLDRERLETVSVAATDTCDPAGLAEQRQTGRSRTDAG